MEDLKRILIGDKTYPFRIDMNVLQKIQEEYGSIRLFEQDLIGARFKGENGEDGENMLEFVEPSIKAIIMVLPMAINEGLIIEADELNRSAEKMTAEFVTRNCTIPYTEVADMLHEEFKRCFATKK